MKGHWITYDAAEMVWLEANRLLPISAYHQAFNATFNREVSAVNLHALRKRKGWKTGRTGCFEKGLVPHNLGKPHPTRGRGAETQFKKGGLPHNTKWLGHERVTTDGYVEISVAETNPHTGYERRYVLKHVWAWEAINGPMPAGFCLKCLTDRTNTDPANWELIPRALLPRLNGGARKQHLAYEDAEPSVRPALLAIARIDHRARQLRRAPSSPLINHASRER